MGWLFAVALGMQEHSQRAVVRSLAPILLGHALAIGVAIALADLLRVVLPLNYLKIGVAAALSAFGLYRVIRRGHFQWGGMQVRFHDLAIWSFLMASAHGAGLMVLPVVLHLNQAAATGAHHHAGQNSVIGLWAALVHTLGYLSVTAVVALIVYQKLGLAVLRKGWVNFDLVWAIALIATGGLTLLV
jgi:hypothetical protein